jgi:hypothetical protein
LYFPVNDLYTVHVKKFYTLNELEQVAALSLPENPEVLWIGILEGDDSLGIGLRPGSPHYGKVATGKDGSVRYHDYTFEKFARYAQSSPVQPEIWAAQENDAAFLKKRLAERWDCTTTYQYLEAVSQAAEYNAHEALEVLLQHGARLRHKSHRQMPWMYDAQTMELLDRYG